MGEKERDFSGWREGKESNFSVAREKFSDIRKAIADEEKV